MASSRRLVFRLTDRDPFMWSLVGPEVTGPGLAAIEYWLHEEASLSAIDVLVSPELEPQFMDFVDAVQVRYPDLAVKKIQKVTAGNSQEQLLLLIVGDGHIEEAMDWMSRVTSGQLDGALFVTERSHQPGQPFAFREIARTGKQRRGGYLVKEPAATYRAEAKPRIPTAKQMGILGDAPPLLTAVEVCQTMAVHDVPVLILGETGTGKELFARYVHACSARFDKPFVTVNCGALPDALVESLLFGHRKGAFTGATRDALGKFFEADGGTLFLDEIGELPLEQQPKLLRALQEKVVEPVGGSARAVDVRVIAATHRGLQQMVRAGSFREDLYYRLSYATIDLPALRERIDDIPELASAFVHEYNQSLREPKRLTPEAVARLQAHTWPGNVRELQNVLGRSLLLASEAAVGPASLMIQPPLMEQYDFALPAIDDDFEMEVFIRQLRGRLIDHALSITGSNQSAAARLLGISSQAINKFLRQKTKGHRHERLKRITIIGSPGAGKSTLSRTLAERLDLPLVHIDQLFWSEGWQRRDRRAYRELIKEATAGEEWIIDGNYISTLAARLERAPLVIWLDFPTWRCVWGIVRRWLEHRGRSRPDMPSNCPERLNREFFLYVLRFRKEVRPDLPGILENYPECEVVHLTSPRDVAGWLLNVSSSNEENDDGCV